MPSPQSRFVATHFQPILLSWGDKAWPRHSCSLDGILEGSKHQSYKKKRHSSPERGVWEESSGPFQEGWWGVEFPVGFRASILKMSGVPHLLQALWVSRPPDHPDETLRILPGEGGIKSATRKGEKWKEEKEEALGAFSKIFELSICRAVYCINNDFLRENI